MVDNSSREPLGAEALQHGYIQITRAGEKGRQARVSAYQGEQ